MLAGGEGSAVGEQRVKRGGEGAGLVCGDNHAGCRIVGEDFALAGGVARDDGEAGVEVLENLVRDGEIAVENKRLLEGEADVVAGDEGREGSRENERKERDARVKFRREAGENLDIEATAVFAEEDEAAGLRLISEKIP